MKKIKNISEIMSALDALKQHHFYFDVTEDDDIQPFLEKYSHNRDDFSHINIIYSLVNSMYDGVYNVINSNIMIGRFLQSLCVKTKFVGVDFFYQEPVNNHLQDLLFLYCFKESLEQNDARDKFDPLVFISRITCNISFKKNIDLYLAQIESFSDLHTLEQMHQYFVPNKIFSDNHEFKQLIRAIEIRYVHLKEIEINTINKMNNTAQSGECLDYSPCTNDYL